MQLNSDGTFDTMFGAAGTSETDFGLYGVEAAYAAALQPDGRIVVAGGAVVSPVEVRFAVARLQPGGALDPTFSADGRTTVGFSGRELAYAVALQPDGRIVVAGATVADDDIAIARLEGVTPPPAGGADRTAPILRRFSASPRRFRTRRASSAAAKRPRRGTTLTLELSEPATVRFDAWAVSTGRRSARAVTSRRAPIAGAGTARCAPARAASPAPSVQGAPRSRSADVSASGR